MSKHTKRVSTFEFALLGTLRKKVPRTSRSTDSLSTLFLSDGVSKDAVSITDRGGKARFSWMLGRLCKRRY